MSFANLYRTCPGVAAAVAPAATAGDYVVGVFSLPADAFDQANRCFNAEAWVGFGSNGDTKRWKIFFNPSAAVVGSLITGGTLMFDSGAITTSGGSANGSGRVVKRGAPGSNTQTVLTGSVSSDAAASVDTTAIETAPILVAVTINCTTTASDCVLEDFEVNVLN